MAAVVEAGAGWEMDEVEAVIPVEQEADSAEEAWASALGATLFQ